MGNKIAEMRKKLSKINKKMPRDELERHIVEFLDSHDMCVLATSKDNIPRATPIRYGSKGTTLYMTGDPGTKLDNIRANPRVSIGIHDPRTSWLSVKGVQITGQATIINEDNPEYEESLRIYKFYERLKEVIKEIGEVTGIEIPEEVLGEKPSGALAIIKVEAKKIELMESALVQRGYDARQVWEAQPRKAQLSSH